MGEDKKKGITKEYLKETVNYVFRKTEVETERTFKGYRGCIERGSVSLDDFSHCGNKNCISCNNHRDALKDEIEKQYGDK